MIIFNLSFKNEKILKEFWKNFHVEIFPEFPNIFWDLDEKMGDFSEFLINLWLFSMFRNI